MNTETRKHRNDWRDLLAELEAALKAYETEHADNAHDEGVDAGMSFPPENCDCDNCSRARALLETK